MTPSDMFQRLLLTAASLIFFMLQTTVSQSTDDTSPPFDFDDGTTGTRGPESTTPKSTPGPNDLNSTDWIIIGVTIAMVCGILIGGSIYCYKASKAANQEKEDIYSRYLDRDELAGIKDGVENEAYSAGY